jgi:hypothetical protein
MILLLKIMPGMPLTPPRIGSSDAKTVNDRLEARIGTDDVILRIDVDV